MIEILLTLFFCWLGFKVLKLLFKVAWGTAKIIASILLVVAVPALVVCLVFAGGVMLLIPLALIALAFGMLRTGI